MKSLAILSYFLIIFSGASMAIYLGLDAGLENPGWALGYTVLVLVVASVMHLVGINTIHMVFEGKSNDKKDIRSN